MNRLDQSAGGNKEMASLKQTPRSNTQHDSVLDYFTLYVNSPITVALKFNQGDESNETILVGEVLYGCWTEVGTRFPLRVGGFSDLQLKLLWKHHFDRVESDGWN
jgi:hypothetical protein